MKLNENMKKNIRRVLSIALAAAIVLGMGLLVAQDSSLKADEEELETMVVREAPDEQIVDLFSYENPEDNVYEFSVVDMFEDFGNVVYAEGPFDVQTAYERYLIEGDAYLNTLTIDQYNELMDFINVIENGVEETIEEIPEEEIVFEIPAEEQIIEEIPSEEPIIFEIPEEIPEENFEENEEPEVFFMNTFEEIPEEIPEEPFEVIEESSEEGEPEVFFMNTVEEIPEEIPEENFEENEEPEVFFMNTFEEIPEENFEENEEPEIPEETEEEPSEDPEEEIVEEISEEEIPDDEEMIPEETEEESEEEEIPEDPEEETKASEGESEDEESVPEKKDEESDEEQLPEEDTEIKTEEEENTEPEEEKDLPHVFNEEYEAYLNLTDEEKEEYLKDLSEEEKAKLDAYADLIENYNKYLEMTDEEKAVFLEGLSENGRLVFEGLISDKAALEEEEETENTEPEYKESYPEVIVEEFEGNVTDGYPFRFSADLSSFSNVEECEFRWDVSMDNGETWEEVEGEKNPVYSVLMTKENCMNIWRLCVIETIR
ncbi:MAG: hypothetical protein Q4F31_05190 [Eubacteriales bacterium]|nr:hypothetical protein [Eubacteriales bacterium]